MKKKSDNGVYICGFRLAVASSMKYALPTLSKVVLLS